MRKHIERASHDLRAVITTYEGKHNHHIPAPRGGDGDTAAATAMISHSEISGGYGFSEPFSGRYS